MTCFTRAALQDERVSLTLFFSIEWMKVTIPSQIRFVEYFERLKTYGPVPHVTLALRSLIVHTVPKALLSKIRHYSTCLSFLM